jgi:hypothetical protein
VRRRNAYDLHHAILGLLFSVLITAVLTDAIKDGVGRPRPNFFWRCFPDGLPVSSPCLCSFVPFLISLMHSALQLHASFRCSKSRLSM